MACGLPELAVGEVANVPPNYAKVSKDKVKFTSHNMLYPPAKYHSILTSYGLQLNPEELAKNLGYISYAKVKKDKVVFSKDSAAYGRSEWVKILACYSLPTVASTPGDSDGDGVVDTKDKCPGTPKGVTVDDRGCWSHSAALLFGLDSAVINHEYKSELNGTKSIFDAEPSLKVQIDGYTCDLGSEAYNQKLSMKRGQAVKEYLVSTVGIAASRLSIKGHGEMNPAYANDSEQNRSKNRRVEFTPMN